MAVKVHADIPCDSKKGNFDHFKHQYKNRDDLSNPTKIESDPKNQV